MKTKKNLSFVDTFRWIYNRLPSDRRRQFWILFIAMSCAAFFETIALGMVAFFTSAFTDPGSVINSVYVKYAEELVGVNFFRTPKELIIYSGIVVVFLIFSKNCIKASVSYWITRFGVNIETFFGEKLLRGFLTLPYKWHLTRNSADLVTAVNWRSFLGRSFFEPCLNIFNNALSVTIMLTALFVVQPLISLIVIVILGSAAYFIYSFVRKKVDKIASVSREYQIDLNKETTMAIHGIKDVKISQKEESFIAKFLNNAVPLSNILGLLKFYSGLPELILESIGFAMLVLSISLMLLLYDNSTAYITGTVSLLAVTAWKVLPAMTLILSSVTNMRKALPYLAGQIDYFNTIESTSISGEPKNKKCLYEKQPVIFSENIEFHDVGFSYQRDGRKIIYDISFEIKKGETIGIIGASGAGKSTLVDLLIGLMEPVSGEIYIDNNLLNSKLLPRWLNITGYVPQSPYIYDGTLAENISFGVGKDDIDKERVLECCTMAAMDDFLHDLPNGIDSLIGERGVLLSGGQQQRVAIARALYGKPDVMIFDEATSSLDTKSEQSIQKTIYSFKGKQTLIIIAHRLSTVEECDQVIWLEKGRVKMIGKPEIIIQQYNKN